MKTKIMDKKKIKFIILILLSLFLLSLFTIVGIYCYTHSGYEIYSISNDNYKVSVMYYQSGLGTNPFLEVYSKNRNGNSQLLLYVDLEDTVDVRFDNSHLLQCIILRKFYDSSINPYWIHVDTLFFDLSKKLETIRR